MANLQIGEHLLDFTLPATDGQSYHAQELLNHAQSLVVVFTCNHCPYALAWQDRISNLAEIYAPQGVKLVAINANDALKYPADSFEKMKEHAARHHFNFPYLRDESQEVARRYGAERTPELFIFDGRGVLRYHGAPDDNYEDETAVQHPYARQALDAILSQTAVSVPDTKAVGCTIKWKAAPASVSS